MTSFYPQKSLLACARKNNGHRASRPSGTSTDLPSSRVDDCGLEVGSRCFSPCRCHPMQMSPLRHHAQGDVVLRLAQGSRAPQPRTHSPAPGGSRPCCAAPGGHVLSSRPSLGQLLIQRLISVDDTVCVVGCPPPRPELLLPWPPRPRAASVCRSFVQAKDVLCQGDQSSCSLG